MTLASLLPQFAYRRYVAWKSSQDASRLPESGLSPLAGTKQGQSFLIVGNGPSLRGCLLETIKKFPNAEKLCVNEFVHSGLYSQVRPEHYFFLDPGYWDRNAGPIADRLNREDARILTEETSWPLTVYLPVEAREWSYFMDLSERNSLIRMVYYRRESVPDLLKDRSFEFYDRNFFAPKAYNVLVMALYLAVLYRYERVDLIGADHSWHKDIYLDPLSRMLYWGNPHFYEGQEESSRKKPIYVDTSETTLFTMSQLFESFSHMFRSYEEMECYAQSRGVKIYNATPGSFIDAFEFSPTHREKENGGV